MLDDLAVRQAEQIEDRHALVSERNPVEARHEVSLTDHFENIVIAEGISTFGLGLKGRDRSSAPIYAAIAQGVVSSLSRWG